MAKLEALDPFDYGDVRLIPGQCVVTSRSEADTGVQFGPHHFRLPVVPANMSTIVDENLAAWLATEGYFYTMHRFDVDPIAFSEAMHGEGLYSSISLGVKDADYRAVSEFAQLDQPIDYATIDIAHGDADSVLTMVNHIKHVSPETFVIAGNVATPAAVHRLEAAGADAIKVGVGPGMACLTSPNTGFGTRGWQLSALEWCAEAAKTALIVADGGIREYGDIAKSIAFGADMVMVGGMLAGHDENPGELIEESDGRRFKVFFGSASEHQKGEVKHVEGTKLLMPYKGPIEHTYSAITEALQSSISYAGGTRLEDLRRASYVRLR